MPYIEMICYLSWAAGAGQVTETWWLIYLLYIAAPMVGWITSTGKEGIRCRWNEKYRELGMNLMYSTDSDQYCRDAESDLTHHFHLKSETDEEGSFKLDNKVHGGGENVENGNHLWFTLHGTEY